MTRNLQHVFACRCGGRDGFTCINGWWVCAKCHLPTLGFLQSLRSKPDDIRNQEEMDMGLVLFRGGPLDGRAYETRDLLGAPSLNLPEITKYKWTSEKQTSERTGATAQVWKYTEPHGSQTASASVTPSAPVAGGSVPAPVETVDTAPRVPGGAEPWQPSDASPDEDSPVPAEETEPGARPEPGDGEGTVVDTSTIPSGEELMRRRMAMKPKCSRAEVSERSGLAQSKIWAIENNGGKRVKDEERATLAQTIAQLEQERAASAH